MGNIFSQLNCCLASWKALLPILPPSLSTYHATNFNVASCGSFRKFHVAVNGVFCVINANKMVDALNFLRKRGIAALVWGLSTDEEGQNHAKRLTTSDGCLLLLCVVRLGKDCGISYCNYLRILLKTVGFFFTENVPSRRSIMTNGTDSNTSSSFQIFFSKLSKSLENSMTYFWFTLKYFAQL